MKKLEKQSVALLSVSLAAVVMAAALALVSLGAGRTSQILNVNTDNSQTNGPVLSITGVAETTFAPDTVVMSFTVEEKAPSPAEALSKLTAAANNVVSAVLRLGISQDDVRTTAINIYPEYVYREKEPPLIVGYIASYSIEVKTRRIADAGVIIESAVNAGADYLSGVYFISSPELLNKVYTQLLAAAVTDAESKADALLAPLNMKRVAVKSVSISDSPPFPVHKAAEARATGPPIMPGTTTYTVSVHITYQIAPR
ncbi:MAG: SIMPL domain-containing protein [Candidatus Caldarchaeum sp.]|nr:SIMPL domain-containing protein [Candidatus Caldarchaeum sp.]